MLRGLKEAENVPCSPARTLLLGVQGSNGLKREVLSINVCEQIVYTRVNSYLFIGYKHAILLVSIKRQ